MTPKTSGKGKGRSCGILKRSIHSAASFGDEAGARGESDIQKKGLTWGEREGWRWA
jgi:hypothetical protein